MTTQIARLISGVLHPLFMPIIGFYLVCSSSIYISSGMSDNVTWVAYVALVFFTLIIPVINILFLAKKGIIASPFLHNREDRSFPYILYIGCYVMLYYFLKPIFLPPVLYMMILGSAFTIIVALVINLKWKISAHMIGIGGVVGSVVGIALRFSEPLIGSIMVLFIGAGLVGFSRLQLNAHSSAQVYCGFLLGFFSLCLFIVWG